VEISVGEKKTVTFHYCKMVYTCVLQLTSKLFCVPDNMSHLYYGHSTVIFGSCDHLPSL